MFEPLTNLTEVLPALLLLVLAVAGYRAGQLVFRPSRGKLRSSARWCLALLGVAALVILAELVAVGALWFFGWAFAENRVVVALPLILVPAVGTAVLAAPRLWRVARAKIADPKAPVEAEGRALALDPRQVVPIQATAVGALLGFYTVFIARPVPPYTGIVATLDSLLIVATALLWFRQQHRQHALLMTANPRHPTIGARALKAIGVLAALALIGGASFVYVARSSRLPDRLSMMSHDNVDLGGGPAPMPGMAMDHAGGAHGMMSLTDLTGDMAGTPDAAFTLTAEQQQIRLSSGTVIDAWTFNGQLPGPELRVRQGDLVEVTLVNKDIGEGVTIHWHGLDVPNAEDGVAGLTQNAVRVGQTYTYRFRAVNQPGSYWYHSHQVSSEQVRRGLFGPFVILPKNGAGQTREITVLAHTWQTPAGPVPAFGIADTLQRQAVAPGTPVRLRIVNTDNNTLTDTEPRTFKLSGTPFQVAAIDGTDLSGPTNLENVRLPLAAGGRYDITFSMPAHVVQLSGLGNPAAGLLLSPDGSGAAVPVGADEPLFDPAAYGTPSPTPFDRASHFDREFTLILDDGPRFYDGQLFPRPTINGHVFPHTPMLMVRRGDLVKTTFINRSHNEHPMHLHGHHALVLSRNGQPVVGSPWWTDTLEIKPGEIFEIAFRADNPGIWMDHCHNLDHAAAGMTMHLAYEGVTTPYLVGHTSGNQPE
jgi:FtsP/CotA-like multicopper oxidase with cupredoxin domain